MIYGHKIHVNPIHFYPFKAPIIVWFLNNS